jgi:hypothetical protein
VAAVSQLCTLSSQPSTTTTKMASLMAYSLQNSASGSSAATAATA